MEVRATCPYPAHAAFRTAAIGHASAGTNCGSCRSELAPLTSSPQAALVFA